MRRALVWLLALAALGACRDFDDGLTLCVVNRVCGQPPPDGGPGTFSVAADPAVLTLGPGGSGVSTLTLTRPALTFDELTIALVGNGADDGGLTASVVYNGFYFVSSTMTVRVPLPFPAATYDLAVTASLDGGEVARTALQVIVRAPHPTLLVDDDGTANNTSRSALPPSENDAFLTGALTSAGVPYDTFVMPYFWDGGPGPLTFEQVQGYSAIVWYTGEKSGLRNVTASDELLLARWLDQGDRKLILLSDNYMYDEGTPWAATKNPFVVEYLGAIGGSFLRGGPYPLTGVAGQPTAALSLALANGVPISTNVGLVNRRPGTDALFTVAANPDSAGTRPIACATIRKNVGDAGTSSFTYVGFPLVNVVADGGGSPLAGWEAIRTAAGVP
ncbi:MAG: hypothetical protein H6Q89_3954 [Myxococcaceae bacterium]|nr:hypothetical protein [Myxococcaceae bacterium]